jgi:hypothetical protein
MNSDPNAIRRSSGQHPLPLASFRQCQRIGVGYRVAAATASLIRRDNPNLMLSAKQFRELLQSFSVETVIVGKK